MISHLPVLCLIRTRSQFSRLLFAWSAFVLSSFALVDFAASDAQTVGQSGGQAEEHGIALENVISHANVFCEFQS